MSKKLEMVINNGNTRRVVKNMPMHSNRKTKQNFKMEQFVDSDFYET